MKEWLEGVVQVVEAVNTIAPADAPFVDPSTVMTAAVGKLVSKSICGLDAMCRWALHLSSTLMPIVQCRLFRRVGKELKPVML